MRADLVSLIEDTLDDWSLLRAVECASTVEHTSQEESGVGLELFEDIKYFDSGIARSVVEGKCQLLGHRTLFDHKGKLAVVLSMALVNVEARWTFVAVTPAVRFLTIDWHSTEILTFATVPGL